MIIKTLWIWNLLPSNKYIAATQARDILWALRYVSSNLPTNPTPPPGGKKKQNLHILYLSLFIFSFYIFIFIQRGQEGKEKRKKRERRKQKAIHVYFNMTKLRNGRYYQKHLVYQGIHALCYSSWSFLLFYLPSSVLYLLANSFHPSLYATNGHTIQKQGKK